MSHSRRRDALVALSALVVTVGFAAVGAGGALGDAEIAPPGSGAGAVLEPAGLGVDPAGGGLYVADQGNGRVDAFDSGGSFLRAFGWGDVASGPNNDPQNEVQKIEVLATGGSFNLLFIQNSVEVVGSLIKQETSQIPFDASPAVVQGALETTAALGPGDVSVSGPAGGPWTFEFTGVFADVDLHQLEEGAAKGLTGGAHKLAISTLQDGGNYEVCDAGETCRAGQRGVKAGQLNPFSVAVDSSHDAYVFDGLESSSHNEAPNNRVQKFSAEGGFIYMLGGGVDLDTGENICTAASGDTCGRGVPGSGTGEFNAARSSVAIGPGDDLYVNDGGRVQKFDASGAFIEAVSLPGVRSEFLAVDSAGSIYSGTSAEVRKYGPTGTFLYGPTASNLGAIAVDGSNRLYVSDLNSGRFGISRYSSTGSPEAVFYSLEGARVTGLAPAAGGVYAVEGGVVNLVPAPPLGPLVYPGPSATVANPIGNVKATLHAKVNPEGKTTTFHFQYVDQESFGADGWASPNVRESTESGTIGEDFTLHDASAAVSGLTPETVYHFRAVVTNVDGTNVGEEAIFQTLPAVLIGDTWSTDVDVDTATLHAEANPLGLASTGYFQYVDQATYELSGFAQASTAPDVQGGASPLDLGSGEAEKEVSAQLAGLAPATAYRYRFVGANAAGTATGPERSLRTFAMPAGEAECPNQTFRTEASAALPDCRAYELVSPLDKGNGDILAPPAASAYPAAFSQASTSGDGLTYSSARSFGDPVSAPYVSQYLARRGAGGWSTEGLNLPQAPIAETRSDILDNFFLAASPDLSFGWYFEPADPPLTSGAPAGFDNLYRRDNSSGALLPLNNVVPPHPKRNPAFSPRLQGVSVDGAEAVFRAADNLTEDASTKAIDQLYESYGDGQLRLVSILPNGSPSQQSANVAGSKGEEELTPALMMRLSSFTHAFADDGARLYWETGGHIYLRSNPGQAQSQLEAGNCTEPELACTVPVSEPVSAEPAHFWMADPDGSKALFTVGGTLYRFDAESGSAASIAGGVSGVLGAGDDLSRVYFASTDVLDTGAASGQRNVYLWEAGGGIRFVATLSQRAIDALNYSDSGSAEQRYAPFVRVSRVSPDGNHLAFTSTANLTGYDNADAVLDLTDTEVFVYDAASDELLCASCNPSGGRPRGSERTEAIRGRYHPWEDGTTAVGALIPGWQSGLYAPRVLSADGRRLFFDSFDALVPQDTNGHRDVYEWEAPGEGSCSEGSASFSPQNGGCVSLISSGESSFDSEFIDASPDGRDVFFTTAASLLPQDYGLVDVYDARGGGGFPQPAGLPSTCEGEACQAPLEAPNDPTPASSSFEGLGNVRPAAKPRLKKHRKVRKKRHRHKLNARHDRHIPSQARRIPR